MFVLSWFNIWDEWVQYEFWIAKQFSLSESLIFEKEQKQSCDTDAPVRDWMNLNTSHQSSFSLKVCFKFFYKYF